MSESQLFVSFWKGKVIEAGKIWYKTNSFQVPAPEVESDDVDVDDAEAAEELRYALTQVFTFYFRSGIEWDIVTSMIE